MNGYIKALLILCGLTITFTIYGKGGTAEGFIILNDDTKLEGQVIYGSKTDNEVKIRFLKGKKKVTYTPAKAKAYGYKSTIKDSDGKMVSRWIYYERMEMEIPPKIFSDNMVFVEKEAIGTYTLFNYFVEQRSNYEVPVLQFYYLQSPDEELFELTEKNYSRILKDEFADYLAMAEKIGKVQFEYTDILRMVRDYNFWKNQQHDPQIYKVSPENYDSFTAQN